MSELPFFLRLNNILLCFVHPSVSWHGLLLSYSVVDNGEHDYANIETQDSLGYVPIELLGRMVNLFLIFWGTAILFSTIYIFTFLPAVLRVWGRIFIATPSYWAFDISVPTRLSKNALVAPWALLPRINNFKKNTSWLTAPLSSFDKEARDAAFP